MQVSQQASHLRFAKSHNDSRHSFSVVAERMLARNTVIEERW